MRIVEEKETLGPSILDRRPVCSLVLEMEGPERPLVRSGFGALAAYIEEVVPHLRATIAACVEDGGGSTSSAVDNIAALVGYTALSLQHEQEFAVRFMQTWSLDGGDRWLVAFGQADTFLGRLAARTAVSLVNASIREHLSGMGPASGQRSLEEIRSVFDAQAEVRALDRDAVRLTAAADQRGVPWFRVHPDVPVVQFGWGCKQRRYWRATTDRTSNLAIVLATTKHVAGGLLRAVGLPVPRHIVVRSPEEAVRAAGAIGYPVVVKPVSGDMGIGVTVDVRGETEVREAFQHAAEQKRGAVLIEQMIPGDYHRLTCVNFRLKAADRRVSPFIRGDGRRSARELIDALVLRKPLEPEEVSEALARHGYGSDSIIPAGQIVMLSTDLRERKNWRPVHDSMTEQVMDRIHPDNVELAEKAARMLELDVAGIDFITPDIGRSWRDVGGAINDVNGHCGLENTFKGGNTSIYRDVLDGLVPHEDNGRIPTVSVLGDGTARLVARIRGLLEGLGHRVGVAGNGSAGAGGSSPARQTAFGMRSVLLDPDISAAVFQLDHDALLAEGVAYDACDVCAIAAMRPADASAGMADAEASRYRAAAGLAVGLAHRAVVLDLGVTDVGALREMCQAERAIWVASGTVGGGDRQRIPRSDVLAILENVETAPEIVLLDGGQRIAYAIGSDAGSGSAHGQLSMEEIRDLMFLIAVSYGLGLSAEDIGRLVHGVTLRRATP